MKNKSDIYNVNGELTLLLNSYNTIITGAYSINPVYRKSALKFFIKQFDETVKAMGRSEDNYPLKGYPYSLLEIKYCIDKFINREELNQDQIEVAQMFITEMFEFKHNELTTQLFNMYKEYLKQQKIFY